MSMAQADIVEQGPPPPDGKSARTSRTTRKPLALWDRIKFLLLLVIVWFGLVLALMGDDPLVGFSDALRIETRTGWWAGCSGSPCSRS